MSASSYPVSRAVAPRVISHFAGHLAAERARGQSNLASEPGSKVVEALIDAAFWTCLRREEDYSPTISLAYLSPEQAGYPLLLEKPPPLAAESLARLAPAVERPGIHLGVWPVGREHLKVAYPILIDSNHSIWRAFRNEYWPADYFVDAKGRIRYHHFGEGEYLKSERVIQASVSPIDLSDLDRTVLDTIFRATSNAQPGS